ncbi:hypothetical protein [Pseudomonas proteolytica]|uniref:hypothetical protein n=1 Tax=Pseudomonas proteolytica TaxID=219574 RepID=UPI0014753088|nr:hypothetical protein [Pseudomonas proteolytica]NMZ35358.1 hypothetical protein [Pseudomonas proteolytica]
MNDIEQDQILGAIREFAPAQLQGYLENALKEENFDFDRGGMMLTGEINASSVIVRTSIINHDESLWHSVKNEVYDFLCTSSLKYKPERTEAGSNIKNVIAILAASLAAKFHLALGVISGIVTLAIIGAFKITKNAWCEMQKGKHEAQITNKGSKP